MERPYPHEARVVLIVDRNRAAKLEEAKKQAERAPAPFNSGPSSLSLSLVGVATPSPKPLPSLKTFVSESGYEEDMEEEEDIEKEEELEKMSDENGYVVDNGDEEEEEAPAKPQSEPVAESHYSEDFGDDEEEEAVPPPKIPKINSQTSSAPVLRTSFDRPATFRDVKAVYKDLSGDKACDWSGRFISLNDEIKSMNANTSVQRRVETNEELMRLASDFLLSAELYGKTIISEMFLPLSERTIRPVNAGGIAGGEKYIIRNILFKFALDCKDLYKGDHNAAKAAGHELKGVMSFYNCYLPNFNLPLMAIIDYRGFRLIAMALLPIKEGRLIYGSDDAGKTVKNEIPEFAEKMELAAKKLNLAGHYIGNKKIHAAFDVEGHCANGKYYLLDLARTFPPELPLKDEIETWPGGAFLYRLLRPELVKKSPHPISSDAGCTLQRQDPNWKTLNKHARDIKIVLKTKVIPDFGRFLVERVARNYAFFEREVYANILGPILGSVHRDSKWRFVLKNYSKLFPHGIFGESFPLKQYMHAEGINMRHMGQIVAFIRDNIPDGTDGKQHAIALVFLEMCARTIRQEINAKFRAHMRDLAVPLEEPYRLLLVDYLNKVFGNESQSHEFWNGVLRQLLVEKFGRQSFSEEQLSDEYDIRKLLVHKHPKRDESGKFLLYFRLKKLMGFCFNDITEQAAISNVVFYNQTQPFDDIDLQTIGARVKHMGVVNHARGYIYKMRVSEFNLRENEPEKAVIMLQKARENFEEVLESNPTNFVTLRNCGQVLQQIEMIHAKRADKNCTHASLPSSLSSSPVC